jgi:HEPN domain-containing protein
MRDPKTEALRWLAAAREDLAYARDAASDGHHAPACFHCQQAAEKAVKALHYARGARVVLGHTVRALIENLDPRRPALDALLDAARELDLFYVPTRYPNGLDEGTPGQAFGSAHSSRGLGLAGAILDAAAAALP